MDGSCQWSSVADPDPRSVRLLDIMGEVNVPVFPGLDCKSHQRGACALRLLCLFSPMCR
jgi:hypothetical protein